MSELTRRLFDLELWIIELILLVAFYAASEVGFAYGRRISSLQSPAAKKPESIENSLQTLVALLMAFTLSMAALRFETRIRNMANEATAIGATFRRTSLLEPADRDRMRKWLEQYVDNRIEFYSEGATQERLEALHLESYDLQNKMWEYVAAIARKKPDTVRNGPIFLSLNEIVTLQEKPTSQFENHVPDLILNLLFIGAIFLMSLLGYSGGRGRSRKLGMSLFVIFLTLTFSVILELDRPRRGILVVKNSALNRVKVNLHRPLPEFPEKK